MDVCEFLAVCNIPLNRADHPGFKNFMKKRVINGGAVVNGRFLRTEYLPVVSKIHEKELDDIISNSDGYTLIVDETDDSENNRSVLNILVSPVLKNTHDDKIVAYLLESVVIEDESVDHAFVARHVITACRRLDLLKVTSFVSDNVSYMRKAFTDILTNIFPNAVHVTCSAHLYHLLCLKIIHEFTELTTLITEWRGLFKNSRGRKNRFLNYLRTLLNRNYDISCTLLPKYVKTRWGTWFKSAMWLSSHNLIDVLKPFVLSEMQHSDSQQLSNVLAMLSQQNIDSLAYLTNTTLLAPRMVATIEALETNSLSGVHLYNLFGEELCWLKSLADTAPDVLKRTMMENVVKLFEQYFGWLDTREPYYCQHALKFFRDLRFLDHRQVKVTNFDIAVVKSNLPLIKDVPDNVLMSYKMYCAESNPEISPIDFWHGVRDRWPDLAIKAIVLLKTPIGSSEVERSFSAYKRIVTPIRNRMPDETLKRLNKLHYNSIV